MTRQDAFLQQAKHVVFYGLKRSGKGFAFDVLRGLRTHSPSLQITAVHLHTTKVDALPAALSAQEITPKPDSAVVVLSASNARSAIEDAARAGVQRVWLTMNAGTKDNLTYSTQLGMEAVGGCPLLFIPDAGFPHNVHRWLAKLFGKV